MVLVVALCSSGGTTKDYKTKMRTLHFNLKDPHNPDLRAAVLLGNINPEKFVRMTANELANKELAEYRRQKEEEALKMSVLDAEAAARFSTAAALDAKDKLALPAEVVSNRLLAARDTSDTEFMNESNVLESEHQTLRSDGSKIEHLVDRRTTDEHPGTEITASDNKTVSIEDRGQTDSLSPVSNTLAVDWASVKAQTAHSGHKNDEDGMNIQLPKEFADIAPQLNEVPSGELPNKQSEDGDEKEQGTEDEDNIVDSIGNFADNLSPEDLEYAKGLSRIFKDSPDPDSLLPGVWKAEVEFPGSGFHYISADALAGSGDLSALLGDRELVVRGRLAIEKVERFLSELHLSKHRTCTLGIMHIDKSSTDSEKQRFAEVVSTYQDRGRIGVIEPSPGIEVYIIPPGSLADKMAVGASFSNSIFAKNIESIDLKREMFLAVVIHRLEMRAMRGAHRNIQRSRKQTALESKPDLPNPSDLPSSLEANKIYSSGKKETFQPPKLPDLSGLSAILGATVLPGTTAGQTTIPTNIAAPYQSSLSQSPDIRPMKPIISAKENPTPPNLNWGAISELAAVLETGGRGSASTKMAPTVATGNTLVRPMYAQSRNHISQPSVPMVSSSTQVRPMMSAHARPMAPAPTVPRSTGVNPMTTHNQGSVPSVSSYSIKHLNNIHNNKRSEPGN